jgi:CRISPR-associated protein Cas1
LDRPLGLEQLQWDGSELLPLTIVDSWLECRRLAWLRLWEPLEGEEDPGSQVRAELDVGPLAAVPPDRGPRAIEVIEEELGVAGIVAVGYGRDGPRPAVVARVGDQSDVLPATMMQLALRARLLARLEIVVEGGTYLDASGHAHHVRLSHDDEVALDIELAGLHQALEDPQRPPAPTQITRYCEECPYVGVCLPEEWARLHELRRRFPRRVRPVVDPARPLYLTEPGLQVSKDGGIAVIRDRSGAERGRRRLMDVSQVVVHAGVSISTPLLDELLRRNIPVAHLNARGWFLGVSTGFPRRNVMLRERQFRLGDEERLAIAREMIAGKLRNQRVLYRRTAESPELEVLEELGALEQRALEAPTADELRGIEGRAGALYFGGFARMLTNLRRSVRVTMTQRSRRPPRDPVNAALSYCYGILAKDATLACWLAGLDPLYGVFHRPRYGRPGLALDLMEEFRPIIADSVVLRCFNTQVLDESHFQHERDGVLLNPEGRRRVLHEYERRLEVEFEHAVFGYRISYRQALLVQARLLAGVLIGDFPSYVPVTVR